MADPWLKAYLDHVRFEKRLAQRTCALYALDLTKLASLAEGQDVVVIQLVLCRQTRQSPEHEHREEEVRAHRFGSPVPRVWTAAPSLPGKYSLCPS